MFFLLLSFIFCIRFNLDIEIQPLTDWTLVFTFKPPCMIIDNYQNAVKSGRYCYTQEYSKLTKYLLLQNNFWYRNELQRLKASLYYNWGQTTTHAPRAERGWTIMIWRFLLIQKYCMWEKMTPWFISTAGSGQTSIIRRGREMQVKSGRGLRVRIWGNNV